MSARVVRPGIDEYPYRPPERLGVHNGPAADFASQRASDFGRLCDVLFNGLMRDGAYWLWK